MSVRGRRDERSGGGHRFDLGSKLKLGVGFLFLVALGIGGWGIWQLARLGPAIETILEENYRSARAMQELKEGLERLDSAAILALEGREQTSRQMLAENEERIEAQLRTELDNITLPSERQHAERLQEQYREFRTTLDEIVDADRPLEERKRIYFSELVPLFSDVKSEANAILDLNQNAMVEASGLAAGRARTTELGLLFLTFVAGLLAFYLINLMGEWWSSEVAEVKETMERVDLDHLHLRVEERSPGGLGATFNAMMARLFRDLEGRS